MDRPRSRKEREERANKIFFIAFGSLMALAAIAIAVSASGALNGPDTAPEPVATSYESQPAVAETTPATAVEAAPETFTLVQVEPAPKAAAPTPVKKPAATMLPAEMADVPSDCDQLITITGKKIGSNTGTLSVYNREGGGWTKVMETEANFGKNGLVDGEKRRSGNLQTPTGIWQIGGFVFGLHPESKIDSKMPYRQIKNDSYWSSERDSTYNSWVDHRVSGEHLIDADPQYEYAFNTGYNALPNERVFGRGTAIFIHCFEPPGNALGKFTHGCIAIHRDQMVKLFGLLDPARNPYCAIGTLQKGSPTSIWAY